MYCDAKEPVDGEPCWTEYEQISPEGEIELQTDWTKRTIHGFIARKVIIVDKRKIKGSELFALVESRIKREEEVQIGSRGKYMSVKQLTGVVVFQGYLKHILIRDNQGKEKWKTPEDLAKVNTVRVRQAPNRLTSDRVGELTGNPTKYKNTSIPRNFEQVYLTMTEEPAVLELVARGEHGGAYELASTMIASGETVDRHGASLYSALLKLLTVEGSKNQARLLDDKAWYPLTPEDLREVESNGLPRYEMVEDENGVPVPVPYVPPKSLLTMLDETKIKAPFYRDWIVDYGDGELIKDVKNKSEAEGKALVRAKVLETSMTQNEETTTSPSQVRPGRTMDSSEDADEKFHVKLASVSLMYETLRNGKYNAIPEITHKKKEGMSVQGHIISLFCSWSIDNEAESVRKERRQKKLMTKTTLSIPTCQHIGCNTKIHTVCKQKKYCFRHAAEKPMCSQCNERIGFCHGGLCRKCFGGSEAIANGKKCIVCARPASRVGGRCQIHLSLNRYQQKKMKSTLDPAKVRKADWCSPTNDELHPNVKARKADWCRPTSDEHHPSAVKSGIDEYANAVKSGVDDFAGCSV